jgi:hypothetical protein
MTYFNQPDTTSADAVQSLAAETLDTVGSKIATYVDSHAQFVIAQMD